MNNLIVQFMTDHQKNTSNVKDSKNRNCTDIFDHDSLSLFVYSRWISAAKALKILQSITKPSIFLLNNAIRLLIFPVTAFHTRAPSQYKDRLVWDSHVKNKTVARPSYLKHADPYTGKTTSLYWEGPQTVLQTRRQTIGNLNKLQGQFKQTLVAFDVNLLICYICDFDIIVF